MLESSFAIIIWLQITTVWQKAMIVFSENKYAICNLLFYIVQYQNLVLFKNCILHFFISVQYIK